MDIRGWHGGWGDFKIVDENHLGSGEGSSDGRGLYFSKNRKGAEYFCAYMYRRKSIGFIHHVSATVLSENVWNNYENLDYVTKSGEVISYSKYLKWRSELGDKSAAQKLIGKGVFLLHSKAEHKPGHGDKFIALNPSIIRVLESYRYIKQEGRMRYEKCF